MDVRKKMNDQAKEKKASLRKADNGDKKQSKAKPAVKKEKAADRQYRDPDPNASSDSDDEIFDKSSTAANSSTKTSTKSRRSRSGRCRRSAAGKRRASAARSRRKSKNREPAATEEDQLSTSATPPPSAANSNTNNMRPTSMSLFYEYMRDVFTTCQKVPIPQQTAATSSSNK